MTKERKKLISYLTAVIILFGGGVGLGYYIWGLDKQKKPDYKKYLSKTIDYIGNIEILNTKTYDLDFKYSDHNPVMIKIALK